MYQDPYTHPVCPHLEDSSTIIYQGHYDGPIMMTDVHIQNLPTLSNMKLPAAETDYSKGISPKLVELTPCGHRSEKNSIYTTKE
jgi:hypothetical protein